MERPKAKHSQTPPEPFEARPGFPDLCACGHEEGIHEWRPKMGDRCYQEGCNCNAFEFAEDRAKRVAEERPWQKGTEEKRVIFFAGGIPAPKGSLRHFRPKGCDFDVTVNDNKRTKSWQDTVATAAREVWGGAAPVNTAVRISCLFRFPRPAGHFGSGRNAGLVKPSAPSLHTVKPDLDKLCRAVGDALKGVVYVDDSRVCGGVNMKRYVLPGEHPGVVVAIDLETSLGWWLRSAA